MRLLRRGNRVVALRVDNGLVARASNGPCCCGGAPSDVCGCDTSEALTITAQCAYSYERFTPDGTLLEAYADVLTLSGQAGGQGQLSASGDRSSFQVSFVSVAGLQGARATVVFQLTPSFASNRVSAQQINVAALGPGSQTTESNTVSFSRFGASESEQRPVLPGCNPSDSFRFEWDTTGQPNFPQRGFVDMTWEISDVASIPCP